MFTGIIEALGKIVGIEKNNSNIDFFIESKIAPELKVDQSVAHNGVCLTVVKINGNQYCVTAIAETISKTNLSHWQVDDIVNLERSLKIGDRLDGHFVQGHVDATATITQKKSAGGSWLFDFRFPEEFATLVIEKGSVCINGVSLTAFNVKENTLSVAIIPFTFEHTNFKQLEVNNLVNIEFDVLGKYFLRQKAFAK